MSGLVVDLLYPNKFSRWRNIELKFFIRELNSDVLIFKASDFAGNRFDFDWDFCNKDLDGILSDYNILIFDPQYNHLNKWNTRIDGTTFNNKFGGSYLLTKSEDFNLQKYTFVYHMFLVCYQLFKKYFPYTKIQFIHLYPGGGWQATSEELFSINKDVKLISTHPTTTNVLSSIESHKFIELKTGLMFDKNDTVTPKKINNKKITVCFSSLGISEDKGDNSYLQIVDKYNKYYPEDYVEFISIGNCKPHPHITNHPPMNYVELEKFYRTKVDIYLNLETGYFLNGWPLGLEAVKEGAVLITTDRHNVSHYYKHPFYVSNNVSQFVDFIKELHDDRYLLKLKSKLCQQFVTRYSSYQNQQLMIKDFIEETIDNDNNIKIDV